MKLSINRLLIFSVLVFALHAKSVGQISKGDYFIDFSISGSYANSGVKKPRGNFEATYMKLISNKIMVGGSLYFHRSFNGIISGGERNYYPFISYRISPLIRYYLSNKKIAPFLSLENILSFTNFEDEGPFEDHSGYQAIGGVGFNYFLGKNISIETQLTSNLINAGNYSGDSKYVALSSGIKLFFNSGLDNQIDSLPNKVLKKGNVITSTRLSFSNSFSDPSTGHFHFSPNMRYFITDRFNLYGSYRYTQYRFSTNDQFIMGFGLGAEYYFKLNDNFYLNAGVNGTMEFEDGQFNELFKNSYQRIRIPITVAINHFHKQKRIYVGGRYTHNGLKLLRSGRSISETNTFSIFGGLDYFVFDNIYFNGNIDLIIRDNPNSSTDYKSGVLTFGIGFILDSNKIQLRSKKKN